MAVNQLKSDMIIGLIIHLSKLAKTAANELADCVPQFNQLSDITKNLELTPDEQQTAVNTASQQDVIDQISALKQQFQQVDQQLTDYSNVLSSKIQHVSIDYLNSTADQGQQLLAAVQGDISLSAIEQQIGDIIASFDGDIQPMLQKVIIHSQPAKQATQQLSVISDHLRTVSTEMNAAVAIIDQLQSMGVDQSWQMMHQFSNV